MSCVCVDVFTVHPIAKMVLLKKGLSIPARALVCVCVRTVIIQCVSVCVYIYEYIIKGVESKKKKEKKKEKRENGMSAAGLSLSLNPGYIILTRPLDVWRDFFEVLLPDVPHTDTCIVVLLSYVLRRQPRVSFPFALAIARHSCEHIMCGRRHVREKEEEEKGNRGQITKERRPAGEKSFFFFFFFFSWAFFFFFFFCR